jgi:hypothetical protein
VIRRPGTVVDGLLNPVFLLRGTNLLASQMPSPFASQAEWGAYHRGKFDFPEYEIGRDGFLGDEADRVAE